jgi:hypothetical protein
VRVRVNIWVIIYVKPKSSVMVRVSVRARDYG